MSFERLNMVIMTIVKYFEYVMVTQKQEDHKNSIDCLNKWIQTIQAQKNLTVNAQFES